MVAVMSSIELCSDMSDLSKISTNVFLQRSEPTEHGLENKLNLLWYMHKLSMHIND